MGRSTITPGRQKDLMRPLKVEPVAAPVPSRGVGSTSASRAARVAASASGEIRIIGGQWRRTKLTVLTRTDLRPTPDRVRETLFNWLGQDMGGWRCLDAFAGTGALGLEAASRGATQSVPVRLARRRSIAGPIPVVSFETGLYRYTH